jgi:hypothetical protein
VRGARWRYILRLADGREELYDLESDPRESDNRIEREPEIRARYRESLEDWLAPGRPHSPTRRLDTETLERLNALGYIR